jgi:4-hydroxybenzoate polyprenyltransferase
VLAGSSLDSRIVPLLVAMSLFYIAGMYLNDAIDWRVDAQQRPDRPIPSGAIGVSTVYAAGFAMLAAAVVILAWLGLATTHGSGWRAAAAGVALAAAILYYDWRHKRDPLSPLWMGVCRMLVYVGAGFAAAPDLPPQLYAAAIILLCYLIGLTYIAKQETLARVRNLWPLLSLAAPVVYGCVRAGTNISSWALLLLFTAWVLYALHFLWRRRPGDIPRAVVSLIAGISLLDAVFLALAGEGGLAGLASIGFLATLALQRYIPGT